MAKTARLQRFVNMDRVGDPAVAQRVHPQRLEEQCRQVGHPWRDPFWSSAVSVSLMAEAARRHGPSWRRLNLAGTLHRLREAFALAVLLSVPRTRALAACLLAWIAEDRVPDRPNRMEPRRRKRRPKPFSRMVKPRAFCHAHADPDARQLRAIPS